jgi:hypothetical protein
MAGLRHLYSVNRISKRLAKHLQTESEKCGISGRLVHPIKG